MKNLLISLLIIFNVQGVYADEFEQWLETQRAFSERQILNNISPSDARRGAVIASPSRHDPNYYYHWVRDAALVLDVWMRQLEGYSPSLPQDRLESLFWDFADFTAFSQSMAGRVGEVGVGEPRYNIDGTPNLDPWGRPQNDGPALRASLFIRFANHLINSGRENVARERIWPIIQADLRYTGHEIHSISFDLWEEVRGDNFYTRVTCREGLLLGAELAARFGDHGLAAWYNTQAAVAESLAFSHFSSERQQVVENKNRDDWFRDKSSGLDVATVLALLHTSRKPIVPLDHPIIQKTVVKIDQRFREIYQINRTFNDLGTAIGRYPEDHYYGGNPWFLATFAYAEYHYKLGQLEKGDTYMKRAQFHASREGNMSEQMSRDHGYMLSARDLTWSYAAYLTALQARKALISKKKK